MSENQGVSGRKRRSREEIQRLMVEFELSGLRTEKGKILIRRLSSVNLDDCGTRRWHLDDKSIRFERH
jgi:hypothetical protein